MWGALALAVLTAGASKGQAQVEIAPVVNRFFGAAAAAFGQTIRVNVSNYSDPNEFPVGTTCTIIISLFGAGGNVLTTSGMRQLPVGQTFFLDLNRNSLKAPSNRVLFRALVSIVRRPKRGP